ncbi:MAG: YidC/Oxa1 family membrane protein insertase, partial [Pyramidobacter sp.]|nr:YidC/Oxa1 family membrane protein insertase [Pyramidobacter sp.]
MWKALSDYLFQFLNLLYSMTGNWGWAIVALTVIVRLVLHPLNAKQMRSMQQMQRLQPRLKVLQEKYANDR